MYFHNNKFNACMWYTRTHTHYMNIRHPTPPLAILKFSRKFPYRTCLTFCIIIRCHCMLSDGRKKLILHLGKYGTHDWRLPPPRKWDLCSSWMLYSVGGLVSYLCCGTTYRSHLQGQSSPRRRIFGLLLLLLLVLPDLWRRDRQGVRKYR